MHQVTIVVLKVLIAILIALLLVCQLLVIPGVAESYATRFPEFAQLEIPGVVIGVLFVLCAQVVLLSVWRMLSLVREDSIFSEKAFPVVDVSLAAVGLATLLVLIALITLTAGGVSNPSVTLLCLIGIVVGAGVALLIVVLRGLLRKASQLERDLSEVV